MALNWEDYFELKILKRNLIGKYDVLQHLGKGGFGRVFLIRDRNLNRDCALKILDIYALTEDSDEKRELTKRRFIKEAEAIAKCKHHNIVSIYNIGGEQTFPYLIMEYIRGKSLEDVFDEKKRLTLAEIIKISQDILPALGHMHANGLIHRDLKPENILIEEGTGRTVIIDFSIAKDIVSEVHPSEIGFVPGTPPYMAPEQFKNITVPEIDIYSYGVILYRMITGEVPFEGKVLEVMQKHLNEPPPDIRDKNPDAPAGLQKIVKKALSKKLEHRYRKAESFLKDLQRLSEKTKVDDDNSFLKGLVHVGKTTLSKVFSSSNQESRKNDFQEVMVENCLISRIEDYFLEIGKGFALVSRRKRIALGGEDVYIDLVFYNYVLKFFFTVDFKMDKVNYLDLEQMKFLVRYFDTHEKLAGDRPAIGLILSAGETPIGTMNEDQGKHEPGAQAEYIINGNREEIYTSRLNFLLPTEEDLGELITREKKLLEKGMDYTDTGTSGSLPYYRG